MRFSRLSTLGLPLLAFACFPSDDTAAPQLDGGYELPDASFDSGPIPDAAPPFADGQAPHDAAIDAAPLPVIVHVVGNAGPEAGIVVVFDDAAGAVSGMATTDATGTVSQVVPAGSQATVVLGSVAAPNLVTVVSLAPGDVLNLVDSSSQAARVDVVSLPTASSAPSGTNTFMVNAGRCSTDGQFFPDNLPQTLYLYPYCTNGASFPVLIQAFDVNSALLGFASSTGAFSTLDAGQLEIAPGGTWSTATTTHTVQSMNAPSSLTQFGGVYLSEIADGVILSQPAGAVEELDGGTGPAAFTVHTGYAQAIQSEVDFRSSSVSASTLLAVREPAPTADSSSILDLGGLFPLFTSSTVTNTIPAQPTVTWTTETPLTGAVGYIAQFTWSSMNDGAFASGTWTIVVPGNATSAPTPALPASVAGYLPTGDAEIDPQVTVVAVAGNAVPTYATLKSVEGGFALPSYNTGTPFAPALPAAGTLLVSFIGPNAS